MALVKGADTKPEMTVRRALHRAGIRFRLHARDLPGRPDISIKACKVAIFVHGCFWHRHDCPAGRRVPKSNVEFWVTKFAANVERDQAALAALDADGWLVQVIWECEVADTARLNDLIDQVANRRQSIQAR